MRGVLLPFGAAFWRLNSWRYPVATVHTRAMVSPAELASMKSALENALTLCAEERRSASDYVALAQAVIRLTACVPWLRCVRTGACRAGGAARADEHVQHVVAVAEELGAAAPAAALHRLRRPARALARRPGRDRDVDASLPQGARPTPHPQG